MIEPLIMSIGVCTILFIILGLIGALWEYVIVHLYKRFTGEYTKEKIRLSLRQEAKTSRDAREDIGALITLKKIDVYDMNQYIKENDIGKYSTVFGHFITNIDRYDISIYHERMIKHAQSELDKVTDDTPEEVIQALNKSIKESKEGLEKEKSERRKTLETYYDHFKQDKPPFFGSKDLKKFFESKLKIIPEEEPEKEFVFENSKPVGVLFGHRNRRF